jgi:hypothetical protein
LRANAISDNKQINNIFIGINKYDCFKYYDDNLFIHSTQEPDVEYDINKLYYLKNINSCHIFVFESSTVALNKDFIAIVKENECDILPCLYITEIYEKKGKNKLTISVNDSIIEFDELTRGCSTIILQTKNDTVLHNYNYKSFPLTPLYKRH